MRLASLWLLLIVASWALVLGAAWLVVAYPAPVAALLAVGMAWRWSWSAT